MQRRRENGLQDVSPRLSSATVSGVGPQDDISRTDAAEDDIEAESNATGLKLLPISGAMKSESIQQRLVEIKQGDEWRDLDKLVKQKLDPDEAMRDSNDHQARSSGTPELLSTIQSVWLPQRRRTDSSVGGNESKKQIMMLPRRSDTVPLVRRRNGPSPHHHSDNQEGSIRLACPYYKHDPRKYRDCRRYTLRRVKDIKQHIQRKHRGPDFYCPRCFSSFPNAAHRDRHMGEATAAGTKGTPICCAREAPQLEGTSEKQRKELKQYVSRGKPVQDQWYDMWNIIFPGKTRPNSIHVENPAMGSDRSRDRSGGDHEKRNGNTTTHPMRRIWSDCKSEVLERVLGDISPSFSRNGKPVAVIGGSSGIEGVYSDETLDRIIHSIIDHLEAETTPPPESTQVTPSSIESYDDITEEEDLETTPTATSPTLTGLPIPPRSSRSPEVEPSQGSISLPSPENDGELVKITLPDINNNNQIAINTDIDPSTFSSPPTGHLEIRSPVLDTDSEMDTESSTSLSSGSSFMPISPSMSTSGFDHFSNLFPDPCAKPSHLFYPQFEQTMVMGLDSAAFMGQLEDSVDLLGPSASYDYMNYELETGDKDYSGYYYGDGGCLNCISDAQGGECSHGNEVDDNRDEEMMVGLGHYIPHHWRTGPECSQVYGEIPVNYEADALISTVGSGRTMLSGAAYHGSQFSSVGGDIEDAVVEMGHDVQLGVEYQAVQGHME